MAKPPRVGVPLRCAAVLVACCASSRLTAARELRAQPGRGVPLVGVGDERGTAMAEERVPTGLGANLTTPTPSFVYSIKMAAKALGTLSKAIDDGDHVETYGIWVRTALLSWLIWMTLAIAVSYFCYDFEVLPSDGEPKADPKETFENGHFSCCNEESNWGICVCAFCCPALRWADTADLAGFLPMWSAFGLISMVSLLNCLSHGALVWGVYQTIFLLYSHAALAWGMWGFFSACLMLYYRQHLRRKLGVTFGSWETCSHDFCFVFWCPCCAVAQEALVVKQAYELKMSQGFRHHRINQAQTCADWDAL